jgi:Ca2+-binding EF-hand superfamily protein
VPVTANSPNRECIAIAKLIMEKSEELSSLFKSLTADNPDEMITKDNVIAMLEVTIPEDKAKLFADLIFTAFDKDHDGTIDFQEFMMATNCSTTTMLEEKLHWVFQMYDKDGSKSIQLGEMVEIFGMLYLHYQTGHIY